MKTFKIIVGLGRLVNHHRKTITVTATDKASAAVKAARLYDDQTRKELKGQPILGKSTGVDSIIEIDPANSWHNLQLKEHPSDRDRAIVDRLDFDEWITTVNCNEPEVTPDVCRRVLNELVEMRLADLKFFADLYADDIAAIINERRANQ